MNLEKRNEGDIIIVKPLSEVLNAAVSTDFKSKMVDLINQGNNVILLNLNNINFIDSSGLGTIISLYKMLQMNKGTFVICEIKKPVLNLFKLTRMDQVLDIRESEKESVAHINQVHKKPAVL